MPRQLSVAIQKNLRRPYGASCFSFDLPHAKPPQETKIVSWGPRSSAGLTNAAPTAQFARLRLCRSVLRTPRSPSARDRGHPLFPGELRSHWGREIGVTVVSVFPGLRSETWGTQCLVVVQLFRTRSGPLATARPSQTARWTGHSFFTCSTDLLAFDRGTCNTEVVL